MSFSTMPKEIVLEENNTNKNIGESLNIWGKINKLRIWFFKLMDASPMHVGLGPKLVGLFLHLII